MKILIVNVSDRDGGAARAAFRLHEGLLDVGVESCMLVQSKLGDNYTVIGPVTKKTKVISKLRPHIDQLPLVFYKNKTVTLFSPAWFLCGDVVNQINEINADVVHLHWIAKGMLALESIAKIKAPIVWTLHDSWAFTGGCHITGGCDKYIYQCGSCPNLRSKNHRDLSSKIFEKKKKMFNRVSSMTIVAVSKWLESCAKSSALLKDHNIINLPNLINTEKFKPVDKHVAKSMLNIDEGKKIILFGAMSATDDANKGYKELIEAIDKLVSDNIELVIFGSSQPKEHVDLKYKTHYLGHLFDDISIQVVYSAADVTVVPSKIEAFGQTASESMSCGTPVVAFGTTGLLGIIDHKLNGYLAEPLDTEDLAKGIEWVLSASNYRELCQEARNKVVREFDSSVVIAKYMALYKNILQGGCLPLPQKNG